ncbi:MAG: KH domain-containing protein [Fimbriimonadales bacterium]|nr:KH domain-containing protein [Fimbriimonadales bacterium]
MSYRPFVELLVRQIVDQPEALTIQEEASGNTRTFHVRVAPDDVGRLIGKNGRVVSAVRALVSAVAAKNRERAYVKVEAA